MSKTEKRGKNPLSKRIATKLTLALSTLQYEVERFGKVEGRANGQTDTFKKGAKQVAAAVKNVEEALKTMAALPSNFTVTKTPQTAQAIVLGSPVIIKTERRAQFVGMFDHALIVAPHKVTKVSTAKRNPLITIEMGPDKTLTVNRSQLELAPEPPAAKTEAAPEAAKTAAA
jgi:hypothetical protein